MPKITINLDKCEGCGSCAAMYPELFEMGEDNKSHVKEHNFRKYSYEKDEIEAICPTAAIKIEE